jgi:Fe-S cluster biogenesis protein NfuA
MSYIVKVERTQNKFINKFEINKFITNHLSFEYNNIDDAKNSQLAQELFYLPFVKKVYITPSFISIERFNIVEWEDVEEEVKNLIENYLNSEKEVISEVKKEKSNPISIYTESTPNPSVLKFVSNKLIVDGSFEFNNIDEAQEMEFAKKLFEFSYVKSIYISKNFVSITKYDLKNWDEVTLELRNFIKNYLEINEINFKRKEVETEEIDLDETSKKIISILDEYIKPAVSSDGGNILFDSYDKDKKLVKVILQGACSGCPSSTVTLKNGIENMLKEMLSDKVNSVEAING